MADMICEVCGKKVTGWSARFEADVVHCKKCFGSLAAKEVIKKKHNDASPLDFSESVKDNMEQSNVEYSFLSLLFFFLSGLSLLGGVILCGLFWPGDPGYGKEWEPEAYILAIAWPIVGIIQFSLFAACGQGLHYLKQIVLNTKMSNKSTQQTSNASVD